MEIFWNDRVELLYYRVPVEAEALTQLSRDAVLESVDISTQEAKASQFLEMSKTLVDEMRYLVRK